MTDLLRLDPECPWVLLDDARVGGTGELFLAPTETLVAHDRAAVPPLLREVDARATDGAIVAGFLTYEAGEALADDGIGAAAEGPLAWFGVFDQVQPVSCVPALLPDGRGGALIDTALDWCSDFYCAAFGVVAEAIAAGTVYQVNLSTTARLAIAGDPLALYARLRADTAAPFSALIWTGERLILSFSPELFVERAGNRLTARPMKGTAPRADTPADDRVAALDLSADPKQRAENRMIVDLIRNDLARVSEPGSVSVPEQFTVERYPNVWQMTSTVTAKARAGVGVAELLEALFPCGSITGAPKRAARQLIAAVEDCARGVYCGAIGRIGPGADVRLSVAIRTLSMTPAPAGEATTASLGLGSGVVADSTPEGEWAECRLKGRFVERARPGFDLFETMLARPDSGVEALDDHLARLARSAAALGFAFDRHAARNELQVALFGLARPTRVRLLLARSGGLAVQLSPAPEPLPQPLTFVLRPMTLDARDLRRWHKTTDRAHYDDPRAASPTDEVVFLDAEGRVTEGAITSVFVERDGRLVTPPARLGLIPGVLRHRLLADGRAIEGELWPGDLVGDVWLGNSLRGLMKARQRDGR